MERGLRPWVILPGVEMSKDQIRMTKEIPNTNNLARQGFSSEQGRKSTLSHSCFLGHSHLGPWSFHRNAGTIPCVHSPDAGSGSAFGDSVATSGSRSPPTIWFDSRLDSTSRRMARVGSVSYFQSSRIRRRLRPFCR